MRLDEARVGMAGRKEAYGVKKRLETIGVGGGSEGDRVVNSSLWLFMLTALKT